MRELDREPTHPRWHHFPVWILAFVVVLCDALTKAWAERALTWAEPVLVLGEVVRFTLGYNTGVAFGLFANNGPWTLLSSVLIIGGIVWFVRNTQILRWPGMRWAIGALLGGALGNFVDRLPDGRVTDFLDFGIGAWRWPTFNLADSCISLAVLYFIWVSWGRQQQEAPSYRSAEG